MLLTLKFKQFSLPGVTICAHRETLRLFMESGWDQQIELVGGTESNIILCRYISPFPMESKMLFRKLFHWERELEVGEILISQMRKQEGRKVVICSRLFNDEVQN